MKIRTLVLSMSLVFSFQAVAADLIGHTTTESSSDPNYSTAYGYNAKTEGENATAIGAETHAKGKRTTVVGNTSWATSEDSVAIGSYVNSASNGIVGVQNGERSVSIGNRVQATGNQAIAQGSSVQATGNMAIAQGSSVQATGNMAIAQGSFAQATGDRAIAQGSVAQATGDRAIAQGSFAQATGDYSTAMGAYTAARASFGVALGTNSESTRESGKRTGVSGYVPEGTTISDEEKSSATWTSTMGEASVGYTKDDNTEETRQVTHVAAGSQDTDAVNVAQLKAVNANVSADMQQLDQRFENRFNEQAHQFNNRIDNVEKDAQAGIAMAIATAGLPQAYLPGKSMFAVGAGTYRGEQGYAMGVSHITDDGHWVLKATGSGNSQGHFGGSVGVGYQW